MSARGPASRAACAVLHELRGRSGVGNELDQVNDDVMVEIQDSLQALIQAEMDAAPVSPVIEFGKGELVINIGTYGSQPAVFVATARLGGQVGEPADREEFGLDVLQEGEMVMLFPSAAQARTVADALIDRI